MRSCLLVLLVGACSTAPATRPPPKQPAPATTAAPESDSVGNEAEAARFADLLTAEDDSSKHGGDLSVRQVAGPSLSQQVDAVREGNKTLAIGGRGSRDGGDARVGISGGASITGPSTPPAPVGASGPSGRVSVGSVTMGGKSTLTREVVIAKVQAAYMAGIKRCYKNYLNKDATARGRVVLKLAVVETGRARGTAAGFNGEVDACITGMMTSWRFPVPKDDAGEPTDVSFDIALQLVPD